jgi:hypothetical protein
MRALLSGYAQRTALGLGAIVLFVSTSSAQGNPRTELTLAGATIIFPTPSASDYTAGFINSTTGVTFTVDATNGSVPHTTTILIRATSAALGGGKVIGDLQWRRSDLTTWTSITATNAQVEQRLQTRGILNDPWSNTIFFRMLLNLATDPPATYSANYEITLSQTVP